MAVLGSRSPLLVIIIIIIKTCKICARFSARSCKSCKIILARFADFLTDAFYWETIIVSRSHSFLYRMLID